MGWLNSMQTIATFSLRIAMSTSEFIKSKMRSIASSFNANDDQADDDIDINEIFWNIEQNPENLVWPQLPNADDDIN